MNPTAKQITALFPAASAALLALLPEFAGAVDTYVGTAGNASKWLISGAGAVNAPAFQTTVNHAGAITLTSNAIGTGSFVTGGSLALFNGFWVAERTFVLPQNASSVSLTFSGLYGNDRVVLLLNGSIIGNADHLGATGSGVMALTATGGDAPFNFTGKTSGTVTTGFVPGVNTLRLIVNNTGVVPITAPTASFLSPTGDGTTTFVDATASYSITGPPAFPGPRLTGVQVYPAGAGAAPRFSGMVVSGPVLGTASLQASATLDTTALWTTIATRSLDATGSASFANVADPQPAALTATKHFFRVLTNTVTPP